MFFSFVKNDENSFSTDSRIYEVYDYHNEKRYLRTVLVIGYLPGLKKYYITILGNGPLYSKYGIEKVDIPHDEYVSILQGFFNFIDFMDPSDFLINQEMLFRCEPLKKENFLIYTSDMEPYFDEELDDYDGTIISYDDMHASYLIEENIFKPILMYRYEIEEDYEPFDYELFKYYYLEGDFDVEIYCEIDFDKLYNY